MKRGRMMIKLIFLKHKMCFPQRRQNRLTFCGFFLLKEFLFFIVVLLIRKFIIVQAKRGCWNTQRVCFLCFLRWTVSRHILSQKRRFRRVGVRRAGQHHWHYLLFRQVMVGLGCWAAANKTPNLLKPNAYVVYSRFCCCCWCCCWLCWCWSNGFRSRWTTFMVNILRPKSEYCFIRFPLSTKFYNFVRNKLFNDTLNRNDLCFFCL